MGRYESAVIGIWKDHAAEVDSVWPLDSGDWHHAGRARFDIELPDDVLRVDDGVKARPAASEGGVSAAAALNPSLQDYVIFIKEGYWEANGRSEPKQDDLTVQVYLRGLDDNPAQKAAAIAAMAKWSETIPITFQEVNSRASADIVFDNQDSGAYYDDSTGLINVQKTWSGGTGFGAGNFNIGGYGYQTYIHEIGHALGLGHGGDYNGTGEFATDAQYTHDSWQYSVMSYFSPSEAGHATNDYYLTSGMYADIEALMLKYFSTTDAAGRVTYREADVNTGNDVYGFGGKTGFAITSSGDLDDIGFSIHDTGGTDTLDFSGSTSATVIDLTPGTFSSVNGNSNNIFIYQGHNADQTEYYVEKAVGGAFADQIKGNAGVNELIGNAGSDRLQGGGGADTLTGGAGADSFVFSSVSDFGTPQTFDWIADFSSSQGDQIDLSAIDADTTVAGNQAFGFIGAGAFSATAGELLSVVVSGGIDLFGDLNGDASADFGLHLIGLASIGVAAFLL